MASYEEAMKIPFYRMMHEAMTGMMKRKYADGNPMVVSYLYRTADAAGTKGETK